MWSNELSCLLRLLCVSLLHYWALWTRPKPVAFCNFVHSFSKVALALTIYISFGLPLDLSFRSFFHLESFTPQCRPQLEPFGPAGVVTLQGIAETLLESCFGIINDCVRVRNETMPRCSRQRRIWVFLNPVLWLCAVSLLKCLTTLLAKHFLILQLPVSSSICFEPTSPSVIFLLIKANRVTPIQGSATKFSLSMF